MAANYGIRAVAHHEALVVAPQLFGSLLPAACDPSATSVGVLNRWPRPEQTANAIESGRRCLVEIAATPTFLSPFKWRVIARLSNAYKIHEVDLLDARGPDAGAPLEHLRRVTLRFPNNWTPRVTQAAETRLGRVFLGFSRFPSARAFTDPTGATTVRWSDMRFAGGSSRSINPSFVRIRSPRSCTSAPMAASTANNSATDAASRRAHVYRRRAAARGRARGHSSVRGAANLREECGPVARRELPPEEIARVPHERRETRRIDRSSRTSSYLINLAAADAGAARAIDARRWATSSIAPKRSGLLGVVMHPGCYTRAPKRMVWPWSRDRSARLLRARPARQDDGAARAHGRPGHQARTHASSSSPTIIERIGRSRARRRVPRHVPPARGRLRHLLAKRATPRRSGSSDAGRVRSAEGVPPERLEEAARQPRGSPRAHRPGAASGSSRSAASSTTRASRSCRCCSRRRRRKGARRRGASPSTRFDEDESRDAAGTSGAGQAGRAGWAGRARLRERFTRAALASYCLPRPPSPTSLPCPPARPARSAALPDFARA